MKSLNTILSLTVALAISACSSAHKSAADDKWHKSGDEPYCKMPVPKGYEQTRNLIVFYDINTGSKPLVEAAKNYKSKIIYKYNNFSAIAVTIPEGKTQEEAMKYYREIHGVTAVQIDREMQLH